MLQIVLDPKFLQDSRKTPELKLLLILASLATKFLFASIATKFLSVRLIGRESRNKICLRDLQEASLATKFLSARSESRY